MPLLRFTTIQEFTTVIITGTDGLILLYSEKLKLIGVSFRAILISCLASPVIFF